MKHKLSRRIGVLAIFMAFVLAVAACAVSYRVYTSTITEHYNTMAQNLSETLVTAVDKQDVTVLREQVMGIYRTICSEYGGTILFDTFSESDWDAYYSRFREVESLPEYQKLHSNLLEYGRKNQTSSIYIGYTDIDTGYGVYLIDGSGEGKESQSEPQIQLSRLLMRRSRKVTMVFHPTLPIIRSMAGSVRLVPESMQTMVPSSVLCVLTFPWMT